MPIKLDIPHRARVINLRVTDAELAEYARAATYRQQTRSEWIRATLRAAVAQYLADRAESLRVPT